MGVCVVADNATLNDSRRDAMRDAPSVTRTLESVFAWLLSAPPLYAAGRHQSRATFDQSSER